LAAFFEQLHLPYPPAIDDIRRAVLPTDFASRARSVVELARRAAAHPATSGGPRRPSDAHLQHPLRGRSLAKCFDPAAAQIVDDAYTRNAGDELIDEVRADRKRGRP